MTQFGSVPLIGAKNRVRPADPMIVTTNGGEKVALPQVATSMMSPDVIQQIALAVVNILRQVSEQQS